MSLYFRPPAGLTIMMIRGLIGVRIGGFYNQDWYCDHEFAHKPADGEWHNIDAVVNEDLRGTDISSVPKDRLPDAVTIVFAFFQHFFETGNVLWPLDYTWCKDRDNGGDPIYIGGYNLNKPGLEIHRHLSLRKCHSVALEYRGGGDGKVPIL